jgi:peptidoglycan hydrolase-like protein with peptidoglycan-binding domain
MRQNNRDATVMLQTYLRQLAYHDNDIPMIVIDGIFDTQTKEALRAFQRKYELLPTGLADRKTWDLLYAKYLESVNENSIAESILVFPQMPDGFYYKLGDEGYGVGIIQLILDSLDVYYDFDPISIDQKFNEQTSRAIKKFQEINGIAPTGNVDKKTWNLLAEQMNFLHRDYFNT